MDILSLSFLAFCALLLVVYFLVPDRRQWVVLLVFSLGFYLLGGWRNGIFLLFTALTTWAAARWIQADADRQQQTLKAGKATLSKEEKSALKARGKARRRRILTAYVLCNIGLLCVFKYVHFALAQADALARLFGGRVNDTIHWIIPLGISFYTFQCVGYVADVYWGRCKAEPGFWRVLLFTSFFPQVTQGPISTWQDLSGQLFAPHRFEYVNYSHGGQRMLWGLFKKVVIADTLAAPLVRGAFAGYRDYAGLSTLVCGFLYSLQIYADFSGYMDIMCGLCRMLGIRLTENFERPYFSKSIAEYWRRWHMSLGAWFKNYVYYPIAMAKWNQKLGKTAKARLGKAFGSYLPATVALVVTWLATGLWHGASWSYIAWGGVNGLFIIFSMWMEGPYAKWKQALHVNESTWLWRAFQVCRTFVLVTFIKVLPEVGTLADGLGFWRQVFAARFWPGTENLVPGATTGHLVLTALAAVLLFVTSLVQRQQPLTHWLARWPRWAHYLAVAVLALVTLYYAGAAAGTGGFLYAQF